MSPLTSFNGAAVPRPAKAPELAAAEQSQRRSHC
jgi:hypothetical protein